MTTRSTIAAAVVAGWATVRVLGFCAGAGAFAVFAMVALVIEVTSDDATVPGVLLSLALGAAAFVLGTRFGGPVRAASVTVLVLVIPLVWAFALAGNGESERGSIRGVYLLSVVTYLVFYTLIWTRGRAVLLGLALLLLFAWIVSEVEGGSVPFEKTFQERTDTTFSTGGDTTFGDDNGVSFGDEGPDVTGAGIASLVLGLGALAAGWTLDKRKKAGAATPFIAVGALFAIVGAAVLGFDESVIAGGLMAAAAGAAVGLVGGLGDHRRGSTWIGVLTIVGGLSAVIADLAGDSTLAFAGMAAVLAAGLGFLALNLAPRLNEHPDGDEEVPSTPPPPSRS